MIKSPLRIFIFFVFLFSIVSIFIFQYFVQNNKLTNVFFDSVLMSKNVLILILLSISLLISLVLALIFKIILINKKNELNQTEFARQIAHDMRSPLSALVMVLSSVKELPEDKKNLIKNATLRINDIANNLSQTNQKMIFTNPESNESQNKVTQTFKVEYLPNILDLLISNKRMQYRDFSGFSLDVDFKNSFGAFANINLIDFKEKLNLTLDEIIQSLPEFNGQIILGVQLLSSSQVEVKITNKTSIMSLELQNKILILNEHLIVNFDEQEKAVSFLFPQAESPDWFANVINLNHKKYLISLDDDLSIHQIWAQRLNLIHSSQMEHLKFQSGSEFKKYVYANLIKIKETLFLIDYEFLNHQETGLDIIDELGLEKHAILVTSHFDEEDVQEKANQLKLKILPKNLAGFIPFRFDHE
jgi:hypothetical protein